MDTTPTAPATETIRLTGHAAVEYAAEHGGQPLSKYADPTEDGRDDVTPEEAAEICREDPSLIYIDVAG